MNHVTTQITQPDTKPKDFDKYWAEVLEELSQFPAAPEIEEIPLRSSDFATTYGVRLTSTGPYRLFAYLSLPINKSDEPFPTLFYFPGYGSVVNPLPQGTTHELRRKYATFSLAARGQRNSDRPFAATFPGLMTVGISDPSTYVYRGIIADCCRGVEYLSSRPEIDPNRTIAIGDDLTLITSGLVGKLSHIACSPGSLHRPYEHWEIKDYLRLHPTESNNVHTTLSYFDSRWFKMSREPIHLISGQADGGSMGPDGLESMMDALGNNATFYETQQSGYKDGLFRDTWISRQFGFDSPILPKVWQ